MENLIPLHTVGDGKEIRPMWAYGASKRPSARTLGPGLHRKCKPMTESQTSNQEAIDKRRIEYISHIQYISLGEGAATCQVCGSPLHEGEAVVAYVFRPGGAVRFQLGHVICGDDQHDRPSEYTLGVRELIVEGRVGWCSDGATQSSWPVLLAPDVVGVSATATKSLRMVPDGEPSEQPAVETDSRTLPTNERRHVPYDESLRVRWGDGR